MVLGSISERAFRLLTDNGVLPAEAFETVYPLIEMEQRVMQCTSDAQTVHAHAVAIIRMTRDAELRREEKDATAAMHFEVYKSWVKARTERRWTDADQLCDHLTRVFGPAFDAYYSHWIGRKDL